MYFKLRSHLSIRGVSEPPAGPHISPLCTDRLCTAFSGESLLFPRSEPPKTHISDFVNYTPNSPYMSTATPRNYKAKRSVRPNIEHSVQVCILFFRRRFPVEVKLTDKPLDKVVYRHDARYAAVLVKHHRHRLLLLFHVGKKHVAFSVSGTKYGSRTAACITLSRLLLPWLWTHIRICRCCRRASCRRKIYAYCCRLSCCCFPALPCVSRCGRGTGRCSR